MSWSSGKDSTMALDAIRRSSAYEVVGLLVTMNADAGRVAMHAVRRSLVEAQAARLGLAITFIELPVACSNEIYELRMSEAIESALADGVEHMAFGDLFLQDVRSYRENQMARTDISPIFPLWGQPTDILARAMIESGVKSVLTCVDPAQLPASFAGRLFDESLLAELPATIDPCGERGEFHTFVFDGPGFSSPIDVAIGDLVERDGFVFCDVRVPDHTDDPSTLLLS
ncbi:MAG TPA: hypothetical protein VGZ04_07090 [Acidimicrobiales bacterium]|jgi:uncharacterized protein (TIGR00290 family)|nr:hypothetical protein [Acidimicrobiales bacterium]